MKLQFLLHTGKPFVVIKHLPNVYRLCIEPVAINNCIYRERVYAHLNIEQTYDRDESRREAKKKSPNKTNEGKNGVPIEKDTITIAVGSISCFR